MAPSPISLFSSLMMRWEVYLEESEEGRIPLSHTGGLKTILLVLSFLYLVPHIEQAFERVLVRVRGVENNLHTLQRRLLLFSKIALEEQIL